MSKLLVFGHLNPDTDTICSSIVAADLINKLDLGYEAEPVRLGKVNKETEYVFNYLNMEAQREISSVGEDDLLWLVDHNEAGQSVEGRDKATVVGVFDHHMITSDDLYSYFKRTEDSYDTEMFFYDRESYTLYYLVHMT